MKDKKDMTMRELMAAGVSSEEAAELFKSEYDEAIKSLVQTLFMFGMTNEEYHGYLDETKDAMTRILPSEDLPDDLTVADSGPYVTVSDLLVLGRLSYAWYQRGLGGITITEED